MRKNLSPLVSLSVLLFLSTGCGKVIEKSIKKIGKDMGEAIHKSTECGFKPTEDSLPENIAPDYDVKFHRPTLEKVLADMKGKKDLNAENFWALLSPSVRDTLNFELNLFMINQRAENPLAVYRSTAYFFNQVKDSFDETLDYKVRDKNGDRYSFTIRGVKTVKNHLFNFNCGHHDRTDLSGVGTAEVKKLEQVAEVYECRAEDKLLKIMEMKDEFYLLAGKDDLYRMPVKSLSKKDHKRRLEIAIDTKEIHLKLKIKKKKSEAVEDWSGKRSEIELSTPAYQIDERGACVTHLHSLVEE